MQNDNIAHKIKIADLLSNFHTRVDVGASKVKCCPWAQFVDCTVTCNPNTQSHDYEKNQGS